MTQTSIPTAEEIAQLPRWARVAFAARCARRVLPVFKHFWPGAPDVHLNAIERAIRVAEHVAEHAAAFATACAAAAADADAAADPANNGADAATAAACAAACAAATAEDAAEEAVNYAANAAHYADAFCCEAAVNYAAADYATGAIRADFDFLLARVGIDGVTDSTPVPPTIFGLMWPNGPPPGWPSSDVVTAPYRPPARAHEEGYSVPGTGFETWVQESKVASGGFGSVWLARNVETGEARAVKFWTHESRRTDQARHEANIVGYVLKHMRENPDALANIVPLLAANLEADPPWVMYQFVEGGRTLRDLIPELQPLPITERVARTVPLLRTIAAAVGRMHRLPVPIVHRDLKPANVLMEGDVPRITDFGIGGASVVGVIWDTTNGHTSYSADIELPTVMHTSGTPMYACLQQLRGEAANPRDDLYSLGVIAFQMLLGDRGTVPGFDARELLEDAGVPEVVIRAALRNISTDPNRRQKDATEWAETLAACEVV